MDAWHASVGAAPGEGIYRWQQVKKPWIMRDSWHSADIYISQIQSPLPTVAHAEDVFSLSDAKGRAMYHTYVWSGPLLLLQHSCWEYHTFIKTKLYVLIVFKMLHQTHKDRVMSVSHAVFSETNSNLWRSSYIKFLAWHDSMVTTVAF